MSAVDGLRYYALVVLVVGPVVAAIKVVDAAALALGKPRTGAPNLEHFMFLDNLRVSGALELFRGEAFLTEEFGLSRREAKGVVARWARLQEVARGRG